MDFVGQFGARQSCSYPNLLLSRLARTRLRLLGGNLLLAF